MVVDFLMLMLILVVLVVVLHLEMEEQKQEELEYLGKEIPVAILLRLLPVVVVVVPVVLVALVEGPHHQNLVDWEFNYRQHSGIQYQHQVQLVVV